ncbi:MAG: hypothetical protein FWC36_03760, partial [Spirochaetes bacterium]|nr:hypothetical protein [Spirochaetota bacterium]
ITDQNKRALPENNDGRIAIWWRQSQRDNPGFLERRNGNSNAVKATGVFYPLHTPGDIIRDMMVHYGALPYEASYFDIEDWEEEMRGGAEIGIFLDQAKNIYDWIELMQNGAVMGFQLLIYRDLFTARVDNANREESFNIKLSEILNRDEIVAEFNGDYYATFTTINYNKEYTEKEYLTHVNKTRRNEILNIYQYDKEYTNNSFLIKEEDVILKSNILLEDFSKTRPIIRNIELEGLRWDEIKLFSTGYIDFNVELPRQMKAIQIYMEQRNMLGKLRVKIISVKRNQKQNKIYIDVIQSDRLDIIPPAIKDEDMIPLFIPTPIFNDNDLINGLLGVCLVCDGTTYFWGEYPEVNTSRFKDFLNKYSNYGGNDNGNTFTMPDFSGLTITGAGANRFVEILDQNGNRYSLPRYYASPNVGDVQGDAIRNITGSVHRNLSHSSVTGAFSGGGGGWWASAQQNSQGSHDLWFNASHVVPTADFNQPAAIPVIWVMRIK